MNRDEYSSCSTLYEHCTSEHPCWRCSEQVGTGRTPLRDQAKALLARYDETEEWWASLYDEEGMKEPSVNDYYARTDDLEALAHEFAELVRDLLK